MVVNKLEFEVGVKNDVDCDLSSGAETLLIARLQTELDTYRCVQLLMDEFNGLFGKLQTASRFTVISFVLFCVYGFFRTEGLMAIVQAYLGLWLFLSWLTAMNIYAEINHESKDLLRSFRTLCSSKINKPEGSLERNTSSSRKRFMGVNRELKSLKELRIIASNFYFDKQLVLTVIGIVLDNSVSLLLLDQKS